MATSRSIEQQLAKILDEYGDHVELMTEEAAKETAKAAARELKGASPVGKGPKAGRYAKGWRAKETEDGWVTYNASDPQLTHLLENGHDLFVHGTYVKHWPGIEHIKPVEKRMIEQFEETITRKL